MNVEELAKRAVACKHWRWMPGMLTEGWRLTCVSLHDGAWSATSTLTHREYHYPTLPDLTDPCTLGGLLALVREAWGEPTLHVWYSRQLGLWVVSANGQEIGVQGTTESAALVAALEAAPQC